MAAGAGYARIRSAHGGGQRSGECAGEICLVRSADGEAGRRAGAVSGVTGARWALCACREGVEEHQTRFAVRQGWLCECAAPQRVAVRMSG